MQLEQPVGSELPERWVKTEIAQAKSKVPSSNGSGGSGRTGRR